ncbi:MAG: CHAD domain-containing protein [Telmatospirillum sp.]|nr:CHAD domain-containing protein [Telmatospirillum sp.]
MATAAKTAEIELKLAVPAASFARLLNAPKLQAIAAGPVRRKRFSTTYFDTPDLRLFEAGIALRVRRDGKRRIQTLKTAHHPTLGALARGEWERTIIGETPVIDAEWLAEIDDKDARKLLSKEKLHRQLTALFTTSFARRLLHVRQGASLVELALDSGIVEAPQGTLAIAEIELELVSGTVLDLYALARTIMTLVPAQFEARSKAERGYRLARSRPGETPASDAVRAESLDFDAQASVAEAFRAIGRQCFRHMRANESLVRTAPSAEGVHQLRVALRRLRSALSSFADVLPEEGRRMSSDNLRWIAASCGAARDWDVFGGELLQPLASHLADEPGLTRVTQAAEAARARAYEAMSQTLSSEKLAVALVDVEAWWEGGSWEAGMGAWRNLPARDFAAATLKKLHRKVLRLGEAIGDLEEVELHELRIRCKKLRYTAEFFRTLFARKLAKPYLAALADVQAHLGSLNDAAVAKALLAELARAGGELPPALLARADGIVTGWIAARVRGDLENLPEIWQTFADARPFWK